MNEEIQEYIKKYSEEIQFLYLELRTLIVQSVPCELEEKLWAKLPSYYNGKNFIRLIPFKDHINIEASAIIKHANQLKEFKITPKGMLQIHMKQSIPVTILQTILKETLLKVEE